MKATGIDRPSVAMIVCGALVESVHAIAKRRGWQVDIHGIPAAQHLYPDRIVESVDKRLTELEGRYDRFVVVYGDCGTAGALDRVLARHRAVRPAGPHCYAMLAGCNMERLGAQIPETYFLTDYLVRRWEAAVLAGLGLDERPDLTGKCFAGFKRMLFLRQTRDPEVQAKAHEIADSLDLPLEVWDVGLDGLEAHLAEVVEGG